MTGGSSPEEASQMPNLLRFGGIFSFIPISPTSTPLPFPKEVNKKLGYRGQDTIRYCVFNVQ